METLSEGLYRHQTLVTFVTTIFKGSLKVPELPKKWLQNAEAVLEHSQVVCVLNYSIFINEH